MKDGERWVAYVCASLYEHILCDLDHYKNDHAPLNLLLTFVIIFQFLSRVLLCLKRALRIANAAQQMANAARGSTGSVTLFVEILNK
jgi:hypothetical protein